MAEQELARKKKFWDELYALDQDDDEDVIDEGLQESVALLRAAKERSTGVKDSSVERQWQRVDRQRPPVEHAVPGRRTTWHSHVLGTPAMPRSVSIPEPAIVTGSAKSITHVEDTPVRPHSPRPPAQLKHAASTPVFPAASSAVFSSALPCAGGKRKRPGTVQLAHEAHRVFTGLTFYFFPNNDKHPARRMRIAKAIEYGATWAREWCDGITHVIADNSMTYKQVMGFIKRESLPSGVVMVNEIYPSDCISFRTLLDPGRIRYKVSGYEAEIAAPKEAPPVVPLAQSSLPLKLAKRDVVAREPETPSRTDESSMEQAPINVEHGRQWVREVQVADQGPEIAVSSRNDPLTEAISEAKAWQHLPLDLEDDGASDHGVRLDRSSGASDDTVERAARRPTSWQEKFQCMQKHDGADRSSNPNARTVEVLEEMCKYYDQIKDQWRTVAYRKAIASLRKHPTKILTKEDAMRLPCVGERLAAKIEEIVWTDRLRRLDNARLEPMDHVLQAFLKIYGVGVSQATRWIHQGFRTLDDLLEKADLTENQKVGIAHYDDFQARIPRAEVGQHGEIVRRALRKIDAAFEVMIMGSYRRGAADSGDVDLIITKPDAPITYIRSAVVEVLIPQLMSQNFLRIGLATSHKDNSTKWHGASTLPGSSVWRRIDFLLVPWEEMGAALIYFTGNDIFNRSIRLLASKKGMMLNQRGLYKDVSRGRSREKPTEGTLVESRSERRIFELLGVPWRPPEHRIC